MFRRRPYGRRRDTSVVVDGRTVTVPAGASALAAVLAAGFPSIRRIGADGGKRGPYRLMGACFDCLTEIRALAASMSRAGKVALPGSSARPAMAMLDHGVAQCDHAAHRIAQLLGNLGRVVTEQIIEFPDGISTTLPNSFGYPGSSPLAKRKLSSECRAESLQASIMDHRSSKLTPIASREAVIPSRERGRLPTRRAVKRASGRAARKVRQRKSSYLGPNCQPGSTGKSSTRRASIGGKSSGSGNSASSLWSPVIRMRRQARSARDLYC
jgi:2Fe-2S iron-sulfur cluster binding domain